MVTTPLPANMGRTFAYFDGLNLYNRMLRNKPNRRWLDLRALMSEVFPGATIARIKYFTALIKDFDGSGAPQRQDVYLRALATLESTEIHYGKFRIDKRKRKLVQPLADGTRFVEVLNPEEKGSDVNLASHLVFDGALGLFDTAVVITNDSDFAEPIRLVASELKKQVVLLCPSKTIAGALAKASPTAALSLRANSILKSQFADPLSDAAGRSVSKPLGW